MLILPREHRAPFIAPGRRNRKVHWNRQRSLAIASLGKFEREDWRRSLWLPESLRAFYPKWNNQFSPGGGSGCGCCASAGDCFEHGQCYSFVDDVEVEIPDVYTAIECMECVDVGGVYVLNVASPHNHNYNVGSGFCTEDSASAFAINLFSGCVSNRCDYLMTVGVVIAAGAQTTVTYKSTGLGAPPSLPIELPYFSSSTASTHACDFTTDPAFITDFI